MPSSHISKNQEETQKTANSSKWVQSPYWKSTEFEYFVNSKKANSNQSSQPPKVIRKLSQQNHASIEGVWVYRNEKTESPLAWAELQSFPGKYFNRGELFVDLNKIDESEAYTALCQIISNIFAISLNDHLVIHTQAQNIPVIDAIAKRTGIIKTCLSFPINPWHPEAAAPIKSLILAIERNSWINCPEMNQFTIPYKNPKIELKFQERFDYERKKTKKRRSFLARLFSPRIDDSLF